MARMTGIFHGIVLSRHRLPHIPARIQDKVFFCLVFLFSFLLTLDVPCLYSLTNRGQAEKYLQEKKFDEAIVAYKKILESHPDDFELILGYARALAGNELSKRAAAEYERLIAIAPDNVAVIKELGRIWLDSGEYEKTISLYKKTLKQLPYDSSLRLSLADVYFAHGDFIEAVAEYKKVFKKNPLNLESLLGIGKSYIEQEEYTTAREYLLKAVSLAPDDARIFAHIGKTYLFEGNYEAAIRELEHGRSLAGGDDQAGSFLAQAYLKNENETKAIEIFQAILAQNPANEAVRLELGGVYILKGDYNQALSVLQPVSSEEFFYQKKMLLAYAYGSLGDFSEFWKTLKSVKMVIVIILVVVSILFLISLGGIAFLLWCVYWTGRQAKNKQFRYKDMRGTLSQVFLVCMLLFCLPVFFGIIFGRLFYGNWFLIFASSQSLSSQCTQLAIGAQSLAVIFTCGLVFWFVVKKNSQSLQYVGFQGVGLWRTVRLSIVSIGSIFLFNSLYLLVFLKLAGHGPQEQYISKIIFHAQTVPQLSVLFIFAVVLSPFVEEIIFRGFIFSIMRRYAGFGVSALSSAVLFGIFHFQLSLFLPLAFMGFVFSLLFERTRSLWPSVIVHLIWNMVAFNAMTVLN